MITIDPEFKSLIPYLSVDEYAQLENNIKEEKNPDTIILTTWNGILIDGHHRYEICQKHNIAFRVIEKSFNDREDVKIWMINNQLGRRNLSDYSTGRLSLKKVEILERKAKTKQQNAGGNHGNQYTKQTEEVALFQNSEKAANQPDDFEPDEIVYEGEEIHPLKQEQKTTPINTTKEAAKIAKLSTDTISRIKKIEEKAAPEVKKELEEGKKSINEVYKSIKKEEAKAEQQAAKQETKQNIIQEAPPGKYKAIIIDPPWEMTKIVRDERPEQGGVLDYPTMTIEEIEKLPINKLADSEGCHIYLWVTQKHLPDGFRLFDKWGIKYQCLMTWVKPTGMTPYSWMYNTEHVLFGRIGSLRLEKLGVKLSFEAPVTKHSEKPDVFYNIVKAVSPENRLEMFSRKNREGFFVWGNEI